MPAWVLVLTYAVQTVGELFLAPATGQAITAQLVSATENLAESYVPYFGTIGGVTLGLAGLFFLVAPWIPRRIAEGEEEVPAAPGR